MKKKVRCCSVYQILIFGFPPFCISFVTRRRTWSKRDAGNEGKANDAQNQMKGKLKFRAWVIAISFSNGFQLGLLAIMPSSRFRAYPRLQFNQLMDIVCSCAFPYIYIYIYIRGWVCVCSPRYTLLLVLFAHRFKWI